MRNIICAILFIYSVFVAANVQAQTSLDRLLQNIEQNNIQLKALRELSQAQKLENKTANNLTNPEVEVVHKPRGADEFAETEIEATQSFDFPTAYKHRGQMIGMQNERVDLAYDNERRDVLKEARFLAVEYVYQQKVVKQIEERAKYSKELYTAYEDLFARGEINVLERNKTRLSLLEVGKDLEMARVDLQSTITDLERLNGNETLHLDFKTYNEYLLPLNFDTWFETVKHNIPTLEMANKNVQLSRKEEQLTRSLNLPKLRAGYVGDLMKNNSRHGFLVSVSVPLWEGRNTVKSKKAQTLAMEYEKEDAEHQYRNTLRANFERASKLTGVLKEYSEIIDHSNNYTLLLKAFEMGQLSLIEYLQELIIYQQSVDNYLTAERDFYLILGELQQWEE